MIISLDVKDVVKMVENKDDFLFKLKRLLKNKLGKRKMKTKILKDDFFILDIQDDTAVFQYHDIKINFSKTSNKIEDIVKYIADNLQVD